MNNAIKTTLVVKTILAVLLFLCLLKMPYRFYQFVRFAGLIGFSILAWQANRQGRRTEMLICCALALLFQPFFKIALGRQKWNIIDATAGIWLISTLFETSTA